jgi:hypothetical protein
LALPHLPKVTRHFPNIPPGERRACESRPSAGRRLIRRIRGCRAVGPFCFDPITRRPRRNCVRDVCLVKTPDRACLLPCVALQSVGTLRLRQRGRRAETISCGLSDSHSQAEASIMALTSRLENCTQIENTKHSVYGVFFPATETHLYSLARSDLSLNGARMEHLFPCSVST